MIRSEQETTEYHTEKVKRKDLFGARSPQERATLEQRPSFRRARYAAVVSGCDRNRSTWRHRLGALYPRSTR